MATSEVSLTAAECAARTGLSVRALRVYEDYGLIQPDRTAGGWRVYGARELIRLNTITLLKSAGLTLAQIRSVTCLSNNDPSLAQVLQMQMDAWKAKQEAATRGQALVEMALKSLHAHDSLSIDELCNLVRSLEMSERDSTTSADIGDAHKVDISPTILDRYVGFYRLSESAVFEITQEGEKLYWQLPNNARYELLAQGDTEFYASAIKLHVRFEIDDKGRIANFVMYRQGGVRVVAPRIESGLAAEVRANLAARIAAQKPVPGSDVALRRLVESIYAGEPIYNEMTAQAAEGVRQKLQLLTATTKYLGAVKSIEFRGVGNQGYDAYVVHCERGDSQWRIGLRADGIIENFIALPSGMDVLSGVTPDDHSAQSTDGAIQSEATLRRYIEGVRTGNPRYDEMLPLIAYSIKQQLPQLLVHYKKLGELVEIKHKSTDVQRFDTYEVKHEHGSKQIRISVNDEGRIAHVQSVLTDSALTGGP